MPEIMRHSFSGRSASANAPRHDPAEWLAMADDPAFRALVARKRRFLLSCWLLVVSSYFALSMAAAWAPATLAGLVVGEINLGLLLAFGEVLLVLVVALLYVRRAGRDFDPAAAALAQRFAARGRDLANAGEDTASTRKNFR